jgi:predicted Fe-Mo cluster-binding NifX family protein
MKIAVSAEGPELNARVSNRMGLSPYLLIVDLASRHFEALPIPRVSGQGAGMQVVAMIIAKKSNVLLTEWCSPTAEKYLSAHGVRIVTRIHGTVAEVLDQFESDDLQREKESWEFAPSPWKLDRRAVGQAVRSASNQIKNLLSVMISVVFLTGLFSAFASEAFLASVFSGNMWRDSLFGAFAGSLFAGNPINSYIIGAQLLESGVSLVAVTAFICTWLSVGMVQLPAEAAALGWRFALVRNICCLGLSIGISFGVVFSLKLFGG